MTVQGNAGLAVDAAVKRDLVNLRTFHIEFDACSVSCCVFEVHVHLSLMRVVIFFLSLSLNDVVEKGEASSLLLKGVWIRS